MRTYDEENVEAVVERAADDHPRDAERPETVAEGGRDRGEESYGVAGHQRRYPAVMIGYVAEYEAADDAADEEGRLGRGAEEGVVADPLQLCVQVGHVF